MPSFPIIEKDSENTITQLTKWGNVETVWTLLLNHAMRTSESRIANTTGSGVASSCSTLMATVLSMMRGKSKPPNIAR